MNIRKRISLTLIVISAFLITGNPSEQAYLQSIANDFGSIHHGAQISSEELAVIGSSRYQSYFLFSTYEYTFGTIKVNYYGIGFMTFYQGSSTSNVPSINEQETFQS